MPYAAQSLYMQWCRLSVVYDVIELAIAANHILVASGRNVGLLLTLLTVLFKVRRPFRWKLGLYHNKNYVPWNVNHSNMVLFFLPRGSIRQVK